MGAGAWAIEKGGLMIYAFYSYKGGVGRTFIMAHCAIGMAAARLKDKIPVLAIDMDLEAPGLSRYLPPETMEEPTTGFAGLLLDYVRSGRNKEWLVQHLNDPCYRQKVDGSDNLFVIPAGIGPNSGGNFSEVIACFRDELSRAEDDQGFFPDLKDALEDAYAYVLIDSRTGLSDPAYASTMLLADSVICCVRLNAENLNGIRLVLGNMRLKENDLRTLHLVATPIPPRGGKDIESWMELLKKLLPEDHKENTHRIYFDSNLQLGEPLVFSIDGKPALGFSRETPIVSSLNSLLDRLT